MAWKKCPSDAAERIRCTHDGGNGAEAPAAAAAARGRGCMLMRGARRGELLASARLRWRGVRCGGDGAI
jgi:hypothetical protein